MVDESVIIASFDPSEWNSVYFLPADQKIDQDQDSRGWVDGR